MISGLSCTRLHDPIKSIPVLDARSGWAKFLGAPRRYQMPIRVLAATLEDRRGLNASLIIEKQSSPGSSTSMRVGNR
jgi:hypothetical protein